MIFRVNQYFLPYLANGDCEEMTVEEIELCDDFLAESIQNGFSVFEVDQEWVTDFHVCEITGELSLVVYLYTEPEDVEELKSRFFIGDRT